MSYDITMTSHPYLLEILGRVVLLLPPGLEFSLLPLLLSLPRRLFLELLQFLGVQSVGLHLLISLLELPVGDLNDLSDLSVNTHAHRFNIQ